MTKNMREAKTDKMSDFEAFLDGFIDLSVRTSSRGMYGRVASTVAINMTSDILLLDEALSAGAASINEKPFNRMRQIGKESRKIVIASHALATVNELCDSAIWMHHKRAFSAQGNSGDINDPHLKLLDVSTPSSTCEEM